MAVTTVAASELVAPEQLRICVGVEAPVPYVTRKLSGFDVDLARELAGRLDVAPSTVAARNPVRAVVRGTCDVGVGRLRVTLAVQRDASLIPYLELGHSLLVRAGTAVDPRRPCAARVAVVRGPARLSTADHLRASCDGHLDATVVANGREGVARLRRGTVDAVLDDAPANERRARNGLTALAPDVGHVRFGIAVPQGHDSLYFGIRGALAAVQEDGTFRRLQAKWRLDGLHLIGLS